MQLFFIFLTALFVSMVAVAFFMRLAPRLGFVDEPDARKVHVKRVPRGAGIGMVLGLVASVMAWTDGGHTQQAFFVGVIVISVFGLWDDRSDLNYRLKFAGQLLAVLIAVWYGDVVIERVPLVDDEAVPAFVTYPLTVFFLLGTTNAVNLSDGLDGLAAGLSLLSLVCIAGLSHLSESREPVFLAVAIMGGVLGFLRFNTHPAQVFMGDTGSQFLGFSLGVLAVILTQRANTALAASLPLLALGLPIVDTLTVMVQRMARGQSPFKPDRNHFHHKLLTLGFDHHEAVLTIYLIQSLFVISAYLFRYESEAFLLVYYGVLAAAIVLSYPLAQACRWRLHSGRPAGASLPSRVVGMLRSAVGIEKYSRWAVGIAIPAFLVVGAFQAEDIGSDTGYAAVAILVAALAFRLMRLPVINPVERLAIYFCVILAVYSMESQAVTQPEWQSGLNWFYLALTLSIGLGVRFSGGHYFALTPSDYLVMLILLAAANLSVFEGTNYAKLAAESAVMLYGVEFVLRKPRFTSRVLWGGAMGAFVLVALKTVSV
ncbi:MAG TPA: MraY family glycosyltransferase [Methylococcaceae bacterium]|nr:MraY family glycosyltransferase [Methylococcaceae bacterium]